ncbi:MAG: hypothetical protein ACE5PV_13950 [Candidatus Poribacteria bacterium]
MKNRASIYPIIQPGLRIRSRGSRRLEVSGSYDRLSFIIDSWAKDVGDLRPGCGYDVQPKGRN